MYRTSDAIESVLQIASTLPDMTRLPLESSVGGRPISALRLRVGRESERRGVLLMAGLHGRELLNPDLLLDFLIGLRLHETSDWVIDRTVWPASLIRNSGNWSASGYHCDPTYMGPSPFFEP